MNSTILIAFLFILFVVCFAGLLKWVARNGAKKDNIKLMIAFDKLESRNEALADNREMLHKRIIGIDKSKRKLLFIDRTRSYEQVHVIDLAQVKEASIVKRSNPLSKYTGSIFIECQFTDPFIHPVTLNFYDEYYDDVDSLAKMEKKSVFWHQTIQIFKHIPRKEKI